jgi:phage gp46-like protein
MDILPFVQADGTFDWGWANGDLLTGDGYQDLQTAVLVSLFTDRRCNPDYTPIDGDRRGWWADTNLQYPYGSRLWQLFRAAIGPTTLLQGQTYAYEALQWLLDDGVASALNVVASFPAFQSLGLLITIQEPSKQNPTVFNFQWAWTSNIVQVLNEQGGPGLLDISFILNQSLLSGTTSGSLLGETFILGESPLS